MKGEKEQMDQLQGHQTKYITWIPALPEYNQSEQVCTAESRIDFGRRCLIDFARSLFSLFDRILFLLLL
ncbi:hypothetical protein AAC387_Pa02g4359 [Persea americana]